MKKMLGYNRETSDQEISGYIRAISDQKSKCAGQKPGSNRNACPTGCTYVKGSKPGSARKRQPSCRSPRGATGNKRYEFAEFKELKTLPENYTYKIITRKDGKSTSRGIQSIEDLVAYLRLNGYGNVENATVSLAEQVVDSSRLTNRDKADLKRTIVDKRSALEAVSAVVSEPESMTDETKEISQELIDVARAGSDLATAAQSGQLTLYEQPRRTRPPRTPRSSQAESTSRALEPFVAPRRNPRRSARDTNTEMDTGNEEVASVGSRRYGARTSPPGS